MRTSAAILIAVFLSVSSAVGQNDVTFANRGEDVVLVRMVGPVTREIEVRAGKTATANVPDGVYRLKLRLGGPDEYRYAEGPAVRVEQHSTVQTQTTITLPTSVEDGGGWRRISTSDFRSRDEATSKNTPEIDRLLVLVTMQGKTPADGSAETKMAFVLDAMGGIGDIYQAVQKIEGKDNRLKGLAVLKRLLAEKTAQKELGDYDIAVCRNALWALSSFEDLLPEAKVVISEFTSDSHAGISGYAKDMVSHVETKQGLPR